MKPFYGDEAVWGIGVVEDTLDPTQKGRVKVRIYGLHAPASVLPTATLPWSTVSIDATNAGISGTGRSPTGLVQGSMVIGIFLDGHDKQDFLVTGTISGSEGATFVDGQSQSRLNVMLNSGRYAGQRALALYDFLRLDLGYTEEQASGTVAALAEWVGDPLFTDVDFEREGFYGLGRWDVPGGLNRLQSYAQTQNADPADFAVQGEFLFRHDLYEGWPNETVNGEVLGLTTSEEYAEFFATQILGLQPNSVERESLARQVAQAYGSVGQPDDSNNVFPERFDAVDVARGDILETVDELTAYLADVDREINEAVVFDSDTTPDSFLSNWESQTHFYIGADGTLQIGTLINQPVEGLPEGVNPIEIGTFDVDALLDFIARYEGFSDSYDSMFPSRTYENLSSFTIRRVLEIQAEQLPLVNADRASRGLSPVTGIAAGRYQFIPSTLRNLALRSGLGLDAIFNAETQRTLAIELMNEVGLREYQINPTPDRRDRFINGLSSKWASLPVGSRLLRSNNRIAVSPQQSYYGEADAEGNELRVNPDYAAASLTELENILGGRGSSLTYYNHSAYSIAIMFEGGRSHSNVRTIQSFTHAQWETFRWVVRGLLQRYPHISIIGRSDVDPLTDSPMFDVRNWVASEFPNHTSVRPSPASVTPETSGVETEAESEGGDPAQPAVQRQASRPVNVAHAPGSEPRPSRPVIVPEVDVDASLLTTAPDTITLGPRNTPVSIPNPFNNSIVNILGAAAAFGITLDNIGGGLTEAEALALINTSLASYSTTAQINALLANYVTSSALTATLANYVKYTDSVGTLADVTLTSPTEGQYLRRNGAGQWVNATISYADITGTPGSGDFVDLTTNQSINGIKNFIGTLQAGGNRVLTVADEGSGNGLDADTLDGQHGSYYAAASSLSGYLPLTGGALTGYTSINVATSATEAFRISNSGDGARLHFYPGELQSQNANLTLNAFDGYPIVFKTLNVERMRLDTAGVLTVGGNLVWHAGNDGAGSGLDADLLDGQHASAFAAASHTHIIGDVTGLQTALDSKLNSSSYTAADVLSKLLTVDGTGSGLDADLIDGYHTSFTEAGSTVVIRDAGGGITVQDILARRGDGTGVIYLGDTSHYLYWNGSSYIMPGGQLSVNGSTVWHAGNDGAGSGLDADLWDGNQFASYLNQAVLTSSSPTFANLSLNTAGQTELTVTGGSTGYHNGAIVFKATESTNYRGLGMYMHDAGGDNEWFIGRPYAASDQIIFARKTAVTDHDASTNATANALVTISNTGAITSSLLYVRNTGTSPTTAMLNQYNSGGSAITILARNNADWSDSVRINNDSIDLYAADSVLRWNGSALTYSGSTYWHSGNDGSGSGLDADLLDGNHASAFALSTDTSSYSTTGYVESGRGSGGVALTINDGYGNANVTWNHRSGVPEQNGNAGRIVVNTDSTSGANMQFQVKSNVTSGVAGALTATLTLYETYALLYGGTVWHSGNDGSGSGLDADLLDGIHATSFLRRDAVDNGYTAIYVNDADFIVADTTDGTTNFIWRDHSENALFIGTANAQPKTRYDLYDNSGNKYWHAGNDGSGSGLDADLLDGLNSTAFVRNATGQAGSFDGQYLTFSYLNSSNVDYIYYDETTNGFCFFADVAYSSTVTSANADIYAARLRLTSGGDASLSSTDHGFQIGQSWTVNLIIDGNEIMARNNGATSPLFLQNDGGVVYIAGGTAWHSANDGSGSGLDADTVDGIQASNLVQIGNTQTITGAKTFSSKVFIDQNSNDLGLHIQGGSSGTVLARFQRDIGSTGLIDIASAGAYVGMRVDPEGGGQDFTIATNANTLYLGRGTWNSMNHDLSITSSGVVQIGGNTAWHSANDGSGSGLDADLLDGYHASSFHFVGNNLQIFKTDPLVDIVRDATMTGDPSLLLRTNSRYDRIQNTSSGFKIDYDYTGSVHTLLFNNGGLTLNGNTVWHAGNDGAGSGLDADLIDGNNLITISESLRANINIHGGGTISASGGAIGWTGRFIVIANGRGSHFTTSGYYDINVPADGTVITGVGGAGDVTVTGGRIPLSSWRALYYILPIGSGNGTVNGNFRVAHYTTDLEIPHNWVLLAARSGDTNRYYLPNGIILNDGESTSAAAISTLYHRAHNNTIWNSGNDGSGSGLDADLLDGSHRDTAHNSFGNGTIPMRHSSGYLFSNYFNMTADTTPNGATKLAVETGSDNYLRWQTPAQFISNHGIWTSSNDGSGSGLDSDLLDGQHGSFYQSVTNATAGSFPTGTYRFPTTAGYLVSTSGGDTNALEVFQPNSGTDAVMKFHVGGDYAAYFGVSGVTNDLVYGGWSAGTNAYRVWHAGNDGSGSGLDADLLDGQHGSYYQNASNINAGTLNAARLPTTLTTINAITTNITVGAGTDISPDASASGQLRIDGNGYDGFIALNGTAMHFGHNSLSRNLVFMTNETSRMEISGTGAVTIGGNTAWHAGNDGSGSGLDADTVDGIHAGSFVRNDTTNFTDPVFGNARKISWGTTSPTYIIGYDNSTYFAVVMGGANALYLSSSAGSIYGNTIWTAGNDGSGSGLDADLLEGYHGSQSAVASTVVIRDSGAHIYGNYMFGSYFNQSGGNSENPTIAQIWTQNGSDNYCRKSTPAHFKSQLDLVYGTNTMGARGDVSDMNTLNNRSGFYYYNTPTNGPFGTWTTWMQMTGHGSGDNYGFQLAKNYWGDDLRLRSLTSNSWGSWVKLWHEGNDGAGSGLDADLLDGLNSTAFVRTDTNTVRSAGAMTTNDNLPINFGTGSDYRFFHSGAHMYTDCYTGNWYIRDNSTTRFTFERTTGNFTATGNVTAYSDATLKNVFGERSTTDIIDSLRVYDYTWKDTGIFSVGVLAQEVEHHAPWFVVTDEETSIKSVDYGKYATVAVYEEKLKREALERKVDALEKKLEMALALLDKYLPNDEEQ